MFFQPEATPSGFRYDLTGLSYYEIHNDASITCIDSQIGAIQRRNENSCYGAYLRAKAGESYILVTVLKTYSKSVIYIVEDLEAFADAFGIRRESEHAHDIDLKLCDRSSDDKRYVYVDVTMKCGCKIGKENARAIHSALREKFGCEVVLNSFPSISKNSCTLKAYRNSVKIDKERE